MEEQIKGILSKLQTSQYIFATEENDLYLLLDLWTREKQPGAMDSMTNNGREISTTALHAELRTLAESQGVHWSTKSAKSLGQQIRDLESALSVHFEIGRGRSNKRRSWQFTRKENEDLEE